MPRGPKPIDLTGRRFGRLRVTGPDPSRRKHWLCDCRCGTRGKSVRADAMRYGLVVSCGCAKAELCAKLSAVGVAARRKQRAARTKRNGRRK